ncbi:MAG: hypothetical protein ACT6QS_00560 [Flavobacteriales bacterium]
MKNNKVPHGEQWHSEYNEWKSTLDFCRDEMRLLGKRLQEIAGTQKQQEIMARLEQLQNQLIVQKEAHDILLHDINAFEHRLEESYRGNPVAFDHRKFPEGAELREKLEQFRRLYARFKETVMQFAAEARV